MIQRLNIISVGIFFSLLALPLLVQAQGQSQAPSASSIQARRSQELKTNYGFSDVQVRQYLNEETKIHDVSQAKLMTLRKRLVATKNKDERRKIANKMRLEISSMDGKMRQAMMQRATPAQRTRIAAKSRK